MSFSLMSNIIRYMYKYSIIGFHSGFFRQLCFEILFVIESLLIIICQDNKVSHKKRKRYLTNDLTPSSRRTNSAKKTSFLGPDHVQERHMFPHDAMNPKTFLLHFPFKMTLQSWGKKHISSTICYIESIKKIKKLARIFRKGFFSYYVFIEKH